MKNTLLAIALTAASFAAVPALAADNSNGAGGFFVNGNVGQSSLSKGIYDDNDTAYGVNLGYRWAINPSVALGVEGGYTDLGKFGTKDAYRSLELPNASVKGWTAGVNGHFNVTPEWYLSGRAGLFRADVKGVTPTGTGSTPVYLAVNDTSTKYYAGAGVGYDFSNNFSVGVNYDYFKTDKNGVNFDPSMVSVSAEYRF